MNIIVDMINQYGVPIVVAVGMAYFIFYIWKFVTTRILPTLSNASGTLSWAAAGATVSQDNSTNTAFNLYYAATTSGALTAVKYDGSDMTFNPSTSTFTCTNIAGTSTSAKYADIAERYHADTDYDSGTVLVFGGEVEVTLSTKQIDTKIAGVISSEDYAYCIMNSPHREPDLTDEVHPPVALVGRVPCKVTGNVRKGDLMVSSDEPGVAMGWRDEGDPPYGSVIGKSLEDKNSSGIELIEVVVGVR